ncbi:MAG: histidine kinase, partial [Phycisphaerae bacterium]|nr:histidine kinase [Saprospiraceae bacterium]
MKNYTALFLFFTGLAFSAQAQLPQYQAQVFGEDYGLGGGNFFDAFVDREQFIWVTTNSNVQRFDGRNVKKYPFKDYVSHAMCDSEGRIWVIAGQSIWRNRPQLDDFERINFDTAGGIRIRGIFQMRNRPITLLVTNGLYGWNAGNSKFEHINFDMPKPEGRQYITRIDTCENTLLYPAKGKGVCAIDLNTGQARTIFYKYEFNQIFLLTPDLGILTAYGQEGYWLDFKRGELRIMDAIKYGLSKTSRQMFLSGCTSLGGGRFLVNTKYGLCTYDLNTDRFERQQVFAGGKPVSDEFMMTRIFLDANNTAWAVTNISLVAMQASANTLGLLRNYHFEAPYQWDNRIYSIAEDGDGNMWFAGMGGIKKLTISTGKMTVYPNVEGAKDRLIHPMVRGLAWDGENIIIGPTNTGAWLFNPKTERYRRPVYANDTVRQKAEGDFIDYIGRMRNGDHLVCGRFYLYRIHAKTHRMEFVRFPGDKENMNTVMQDSEGNIWLGTEKGVICLDENYRFLFSVPMLGISTVLCIFEHRKGEILVGTRKGLFQLTKSNQGFQIDPVPTLADGFNVTGIFRDTLQRYWICSHNGLYVADSTLKNFKKFDFADNIQSNIYNDGGLLRASNGMLFLGGQNGINYFYPERISLSDQPLLASIQSISIHDGDSVLHAGANNLQLKHSENTLTFEVVAPYFNNAAKVQYRYRLQGHSDAWINIGSNTSFRLTDLPPSKYVLEVAASITGKTWYMCSTPLNFTIQKPFWQTWWFRLLSIGAFFGAFAFFIRYRENRVRSLQEQQLELEKLRTTALQYELEIEQVVNYFNRSISDKNTVDETLWDVAQQCIARLGWEDCVIYLLDPERNVLVQKAAWGQKSTPDFKIINPIELPLGQGIVGTVAATGRAELIADTAADPRYIVDDASRHSELAVPILAEGRAIGVIDSEHSQKGFYTPWHLQILTAIAALCSNKIVLTQIEEARQEVRRQLEEKEKSLLEIEKRSAQIRLIALTNHLNPHFLFNSLTSLNSLIFENQQLASDFLQHLSKVYRYLLQHKEKETVSLKNELDFVENYIFLLKTRFEDDIMIDIKTPKNGVLEKGIVPVTIQILIENAVKHNVISAQSPLCICVEADDNTLTVSNNIQRKKQVETSNRQGLESLRALYHYLSD